MTLTGNEAVTTPVLLVIDVLNDFTRQHSADDRASLVGRINDLAALVRDANGRVIWIRQEFAADLHDAFLGMRRDNDRVTIAGTYGAQLDETLVVGRRDEIIIKKRYSAFFGTDLEAILPPPAETVIVICGLNTHACVRMSVIDAYQRDYEVVVATDATRSYDREHHDVTLRYLGSRIARLKTNAQIAALFNLSA